VELNGKENIRISGGFGKLLIIIDIGSFILSL
jgi:hypothetical protein